MTLSTSPLISLFLHVLSLSNHATAWSTHLGAMGGFHWKANDAINCWAYGDKGNYRSVKIINETGANLGCPGVDMSTHCQICTPFDFYRSWKTEHTSMRRHLKPRPHRVHEWKRRYRPNRTSGFGDAFWMDLSLAKIDGIIDHGKLEVLFFTNVSRADFGVQFVDIKREGGEELQPYDFAQIAMLSRRTAHMSDGKHLVSFSFSCFPTTVSRLNTIHGFRIVNLMSPPASLWMQAKYQLFNSSTQDQTVTLGLYHGDTQLFTFMVEDNGAELERVKLSAQYDPSNSSDETQQQLRSDSSLYLEAFVFHENSTCIQEFLRRDACVPGDIVLPCLENIFDRSKAKDWIGTHISFVKGTQVTLSGSSQPVRSPGRWFVLVTCNGHRSNGSTCREASITLTTTPEFALWSVLQGLAFMFFAPILAFLWLMILFTARSKLLKYFMRGTSLEHVYESRIKINLRAEYWKHIPAEIWGHLVEPKRTFHTMWLLVLGLFVATAGQYAVAQWDSMQWSADRDKCFYNELCYYPWGTWSVPLNNMLSHLPYLLGGLSLICMVNQVRREVEFDARPFYAIAATIIAEGFGSACYHICPSMLTFQFDTCFMIPISHMCCVALANLPRRYDAWTLLVKYFLYILTPIWVFNFVGTEYDVGNITITGGELYYAFFIAVMLVWVVFSVQCIDRLFVVEHPDSTPEPSAARSISTKCVSIGLKGMCISIVGACGHPDVRSTIGGMANAFLLCSIAVMLVINVWQSITLDSLDGSLGLLCRTNPCVLLIKFFHVFVALVVLYFAMDFFEDKVVEVAPGTNAAMSHDANQNCVFGIFDLHDLWHLLSGLGLLMWVAALFDLRTRHRKMCRQVSDHSSYLLSS